MSSNPYRNRIVGHGTVDPRDVQKNPANWRLHPEEQTRALRAVLAEVGYVAPIIINQTTGRLVDGHARIDDAIATGNTEVPVTYIELSENEELAVLATLDTTTAMAVTDRDALRAVLAAVEAETAELQDFLDSLDPTPEAKNIGSVTDTFGVPPFTVLDTRQGYWQDRKRIWREIIGDNGESREGALGESDVMMAINSGVSILDPVLAEVMVGWFGMREGIAYDPFAGDTVFGFVAAARGMRFRGIELRQEQAQLNQRRVDQAGLDAVYFNDDSRNQDQHIPDASVDLVFSCPPYADLEVYSDDPRDLSTLSHAEFLDAYETILAGTYRKLRDNRFAVIVTSEVRTPTGGYLGLVPRTITMMERAGFTYYNQLVLVGVAGTLPIRAPRAMQRARKAGRQHQDVLVFSKGDPEQAAKEIAAAAIAEYRESKRATADHQSVLVFAKGDPAQAAKDLGIIALTMPEAPAA